MQEKNRLHGLVLFAPLLAPGTSLRSRGALPAAGLFFIRFSFNNKQYQSHKLSGRGEYPCGNLPLSASGNLRQGVGGIVASREPVGSSSARTGDSEKEQTKVCSFSCQ